MVSKVFPENKLFHFSKRAVGTARNKWLKEALVGYLMRCCLLKLSLNYLKFKIITPSKRIQSQIRLDYQIYVSLRYPRGISWQFCLRKTTSTFFPSGNYMFKVNNRNTRTRWLTIKTLKRRQTRRSGFFPANNYLYKVNNRNTRKMREICSKLIIKTSELRQWPLSGVFIVTFKHISHLFLVLALLTLNK